VLDTYGSEWGIQECNYGIRGSEQPEFHDKSNTGPAPSNPYTSEQQWQRQMGYGWPDGFECLYEENYQSDNCNNSSQSSSASGNTSHVTKICKCDPESR
jgi:hypothetical protein